MLKIKCSAEVMRAFENQLSDTETGYGQNGAVNIPQLERVCRAVSRLGLEKYAKSRATLKQDISREGSDCILSCKNGRLDMNSSAIYMCAFYIRAGFHPVLIYSLNDIFIGVWTKENKYFEMSGEQKESCASLIKNNVYPQKGDLLLIDSWNAVNGEYNFWNGSQACEEKIPSVRRIVDFNRINRGSSDCIILDESPYRTRTQIKENVSALISSKQFSSEKPVRNFRNVHFSDMSCYDMSVSDMIQQNNSYFIKNVNSGKQIILAVDASLNMVCQGRKVLLVCDEDMLGSVSVHIESIGLKANHGFISMTEYEDYIDMDNDENNWEVLLDILHFPKKKGSPPEEKVTEEPVQEYDDTAFSDAGMEEFFRLADREKRLFSVPAGSDRTLWDIWKDYSGNCSAGSGFDKDSEKILSELDKCIEQNPRKCREIIEHLRKTGELRKKCLIDIDSDVFDFTCFNQDYQIDEFTRDTDRIYESRKKLDSIYFRISPVYENPFCFEDMMKYKEAFEKLLEIRDCGENPIDYSEYQKYLSYKENREFFSGGDADEYLDEYSAGELDDLIHDIETCCAKPLHMNSQDTQTAKSNVYSLLRKIVPAGDEASFRSIFSWNPRRKNQILSFFRQLVAVRKSICQNFAVLKSLNEIFRENVDKNSFDRQCAWLRCCMELSESSQVAEEMARYCCSGENEIKSDMKKYIAGYNNSITIDESLLKYIGVIHELIHSNVYQDYLSEKEILTGYGLGSFTGCIEHCDSQISVDETVSLIEKYVVKAGSSAVIRNAGENIQEIPYIHALYERMLKDLKQHYYHLMTHEQDVQTGFVICTPGQAYKYETLHFDKLIICETEKIQYSSLERLMQDTGYIVFMSELQELPRDDEESDISLVEEELNPFNYCQYGPEEE